MDLSKFSCSCALLLTAILIGSLEAGYVRPMAQQWPWNSYTTTTASPEGSENLSTVAPVSTTPAPPPPEINFNFLRPGNTGGENTNDDGLIVVDPVTNEQYWISRQTFMERFAGQNSQIPLQQQQQPPLPSSNPGQINQPTVRCGHYFSRACNTNKNNINGQQQNTQEQMEIAATTYPIRLPLFEDNRAVVVPQHGPAVPSSFVDNELYNNYNRLYNNYYNVQEVYPYPSIHTNHFNQGVVNSQLMKLLFSKFDPDTAIYSYAAIQNSATTRLNNNNDSDNRRDRPTIRPRRPKLTSTWIPIIYRSSTEKAIIDEQTTITAGPQTSSELSFTSTEAPLTTTLTDDSTELFYQGTPLYDGEETTVASVDYPEATADSN